MKNLFGFFNEKKNEIQKFREFNKFVHFNIKQKENYT